MCIWKKEEKNTQKNLQHNQRQELYHYKQQQTRKEA